MAGNAEVMLALGGVVFLGFVASVVFERFGMPDIVILLLIGILLGPATGIIPASSLSAVAGPFATLALVVILFEGGLDLDAMVLRRQFGTTSILLFVSFAITAAAVGAFGYFVLDLAAATAALLGLVLAPLSSSVLIPLVGRIGIQPGTRAILTLESALGDVLAVVATTLLVDALAAGAASTGPLLLELGSGILIGTLLAAGLGVAWLVALRWLKGRPYAYMVTFAAALVLYGLVEAQRGSGVFAVLVFALVLGNAHHVTRRLPGFEPGSLDDRIRWFHAEMSFLVRTFFFVYLGSSLLLKDLGLAFLFAVGGSLLAILASRAAVVGVLVRTSPEVRSDAGYLVFLIPRGLASAVLAGAPAVVAVGGGALTEQVGGVILVTNLAMTAYIVARRRGSVRADLEAPADWAVVRRLHALPNGDK